ncbi:MAG: hypothetical protein Q8P30_01085 [Candidatus Uhrbacteria bacterium]|nr:hypothetical protein [Candidatus Uhrbacteria bacterium]
MNEKGLADAQELMAYAGGRVAKLGRSATVYGIYLDQITDVEVRQQLVVELTALNKALPKLEHFVTTIKNRGPEGSESHEAVCKNQQQELEKLSDGIKHPIVRISDIIDSYARQIRASDERLENESGIKNGAAKFSQDSTQSVHIGPKP